MVIQQHSPDRYYTAEIVQDLFGWILLRLGRFLQSKGNFKEEALPSYQEALMEMRKIGKRHAQRGYHWYRRTEMQEVRELVKGLTAAVRMDGLPNRWLSTEIAEYCALPPLSVERIVKSRTGALIDQHPCRLEISEEDGCAWVGVDPLALRSPGKICVNCLQDGAYSCACSLLDQPDIGILGQQPPMWKQLPQLLIGGNQVEGLVCWRIASTRCARSAPPGWPRTSKPMEYTVMSALLMLLQTCRKRASSSRSACSYVLALNP